MDLNIAHLSQSTHNLGPGERAVVWVQGCPHRCPGCIAPEWLSIEARRLISPLALLDELLVSKTITGLTFSGGEPMAQAGGLAILARLARERIPNLNIICFTGYRLEQLVKHPPNPAVHGLLAELDVLVDGLYVRSLNNGIGLRGSTNQRIIHLTPRLANHNLEELPRNLDFFIDAGEIKMIGIPPLWIEPLLKEVF